MASYITTPASTTTTDALTNNSGVNTPRSTAVTGQLRVRSPAMEGITAAPMPNADVAPSGAAASIG